jgi:hypothetical protein
VICRCCSSAGLHAHHSARLCSATEQTTRRSERCNAVSTGWGCGGDGGGVASGQEFCRITHSTIHSWRLSCKRHSYADDRWSGCHSGRDIARTTVVLCQWAKRSPLALVSRSISDWVAPPGTGITTDNYPSRPKPSNSVQVCHGPANTTQSPSRLAVETPLAFASRQPWC